MLRVLILIKASVQHWSYFNNMLKALCTTSEIKCVRLLYRQGNALRIIGSLWLAGHWWIPLIMGQKCEFWGFIYFILNKLLNKQSDGLRRHDAHVTKLVKLITCFSENFLLLSVQWFKEGQNKFSSYVARRAIRFSELLLSCVKR